jgi:hypothetical protein
MKVIRFLKIVKSLNKKMGRSKRCIPTSSRESGEGIIEVTEFIFGQYMSLSVSTVALGGNMSDQQLQLPNSVESELSKQPKGSI